MTAPRTTIYDAHGDESIYVKGYNHPKLGAIVIVRQDGAEMPAAMWANQARALASALVAAADWVDEQ